MEKISQPVRILAIVIVLAGAAGMLGMRMLGPTAVAESTAAPVVTHHAAAVTPKSKAKANPVKTTPAKPKPAKAKAASAKIAPSKAKVPALNALTPAIPPTGFPRAIDSALRRHAVLVVSLVLPGARVDELAAAEAQAGAKLSGAGYLSLNVLNEDVARALLSKLDVGEDPSVLVLRRSGEVAIELSGFVDRETVAQAAANASA